MNEGQLAFREKLSRNEVAEKWSNPDLPEASRTERGENSSVETWKDILAPEKSQPYFQKILSFLDQERAKGKTIYPSKEQTFHALSATPFSEVKVVILGQDPYHGPGQAHGLSFSVPEGVPSPPSLQNIFREIHSDLGLGIPKHGCLEYWAKQGVLLLNAVLSVEARKAASHAKLGWEAFTDKVISELSARKTGIVFLLWGSYAQKKSALINAETHHLLKAPHPSPLSAHRGFLGCKHFSKSNALLQAQGKTPIDWSLP
jgi:uracil-DNA glycosylase